MISDQNGELKGLFLQLEWIQEGFKLIEVQNIVLVIVSFMIQPTVNLCSISDCFAVITGLDWLLKSKCERHNSGTMELLYCSKLQSPA